MIHRATASSIAGMSEDLHSHATADCTSVPLAETVRTFAYIGLNSFGGPTGQIALMHRVLVEEKRWISEERFLHALNFCMLLPGPEAMQLVTYVGWLLHGTRGGIIAGMLFVLPGFLAILALSILYTTLGDVGLVQGLLFGLRAAVLAIVVAAVLRIGRRVLKGSMMYGIAAAAFIALFAFQVPFPLVIGGAAVIGLFGARLRPGTFAADLGSAASAPHRTPTLRSALVVLATWLPIWLVPVIALQLWLGADNIFAAQSLFFSKAAVVTFGGAYAVLAYVAQQAVEVFHWIAPGEMLIGLGLAESTPGPLIMVLQFVAYIGAFREPGPLHPMIAGALASVVAAWTTFAPCFLWIFLGAPFMEAIRSRRALVVALSCISAAVVGVVLNLAVWFAANTLFGSVTERSWAGGTIPWPDWSTLDISAASVALLAAVMLFVLKRGVPFTLAVSAAAGIAWRVVSAT